MENNPQPSVDNDLRLGLLRPVIWVICINIYIYSMEPPQMMDKKPPQIRACTITVIFQNCLWTAIQATRAHEEKRCWYILFRKDAVLDTNNRIFLAFVSKISFQ